MIIRILWLILYEYMYNIYTYAKYDTPEMLSLLDLAIACLYGSNNMRVHLAYSYTYSIDYTYT